MTPMLVLIGKTKPATLRIFLSSRRCGRTCTWIDSASQGHVVTEETFIRKRTGRKLKLQGVMGETSFAEEVEISLPAPTIDGIKHAFRPTGPSMFTKSSTDNILSYALLKKQGYCITLTEGSDSDQTFGGTITTPDGESVIELVFEDSMYRLPLLEERQQKKRKTAPTGVEHPLFSRPMVLPSLMTDTERMQ